MHDVTSSFVTICRNADETFVQAESVSCPLRSPRRSVKQGRF